MADNKPAAGGNLTKDWQATQDQKSAATRRAFSLRSRGPLPLAARSLGLFCSTGISSTTETYRC